MKLILTVVAAVLLSSDASADIRSVYIDSPVAATEYQKRADHRRRYGVDRHHDRERVGPSVLNPRLDRYGATGPRYYPVDQYRHQNRPLDGRRFSPSTLRISTFAPTYEPGGWKTSPWYRSSPTVVSPRINIRDGRSAEQLQVIYGDQSSLFRR